MIGVAIMATAIRYRSRNLRLIRTASRVEIGIAPRLIARCRRSSGTS